MSGLAYACYGKGCGWVLSYEWLWHRIHWLAIPVMAAIFFLTVLAAAIVKR